LWLARPLAERWPRPWERYLPVVKEALEASPSLVWCSETSVVLFGRLEPLPLHPNPRIMPAGSSREPNCRPASAFPSFSRGQSRWLNRLSRHNRLILYQFRNLRPNGFAVGQFTLSKVKYYSQVTVFHLHCCSKRFYRLLCDFTNHDS